MKTTKTTKKNETKILKFWGMHLTQPPTIGCVFLISLYVAGSVITAY
jgi:hypothetical protein